MTTTPLNDALKPCPFCGSSNVSNSSGIKGNGDPWPYIECDDCSACAEPELWNTRTNTPESSAAQGAMTDANVQRNIDLLRTRSQVGIEKYGTTTDKSGLTHKQWLQHLLEELLDGANYIQAALDTDSKDGNGNK